MAVEITSNMAALLEPILEFIWNILYSHLYQPWLISLHIPMYYLNDMLFIHVRAVLHRTTLLLPSE